MLRLTLADTRAQFRGYPNSLLNKWLSVCVTNSGHITVVSYLKGTDD